MSTVWGVVLVLLASWLWARPGHRSPGRERMRDRARRARRPHAGHQARELADGARMVRELASLLRSGQGLDGALASLAKLERDTAAPVRALQALRLRRLAPWSTAPDSPEPAGQHADPLLGRLQLCIEVCAESGAPLAEVLDHLADDLEASLDAHRGFEVAMAGPKATTRLLTWLPALGLAGSVLFGIDVIGTFSSSTVGQLALVAGIILWAANRWWCRWLLHRCAEQAMG